MFRISDNTFFSEGKNMQRFLWVFLLLTSVCYADVNQTEPNIVSSFQKQIENLTAENQRLKQQLANKDKEIERLKALCRENGVNVSVSPAHNDLLEKQKDMDLHSQSTGFVTYQGQKRTRRWFESMYERFKDKIVCVDGNYVVQTANQPKKDKVGTIQTTPAEINSIITFPNDCTILQVLGTGEALIRRNSFKPKISSLDGHQTSADAWSQITIAANTKPEILFHLSGYKERLVDGQNVSSNKLLICDGTYVYKTTQGAQKTIQSFKIWPPEPITKEQFAEALKKGIELPIRH